MNKKAAFYKYAKVYNWLIKEAEKVRDYNYIPRNSVFSADLASDYWAKRKLIQSNPDLTPELKAILFNRLNRKTHNDISNAQARLRNNTRASAFREGMAAWENNTLRNSMNTLKEFLGMTEEFSKGEEPLAGRFIGSALYNDNRAAGDVLRNNIRTTINAENALGLIAPYIEDPQVRRHIETVPVKVTGFNSNSSPNGAAHYDRRNGEILMSDYLARKNPHVPIHEAMHGVQYVSPNASNEAKAQWLNYTNDKNNINKPYSYVDANGATLTSPRANATYAIESGANQLADDYTRKATENLPRRMRNTIRRGMLIEGDRANAMYQQSLGINPNATVQKTVNHRKFTKAVNAAARMAGVNAKKNLDIAGARRAVWHTSFIDDTIDMLRASGYEISPELETEIRQGYNIKRKEMHNADKIIKRQKWLDRTKQNPALLEKAKRLGRFVKVGYYKRMYKTFKRLLLQGI